MMDTIIYQNGAPFRWLFTSEQTGEILKKKNCKVTPAEIVASLKKRAGKLRGKKLSHRERTKFATVWYRDSMGRLVLRLLDETELYFLLGDRTYTQLISAIQVFFHGLPYKGSGIFELNYLNVSSAAPTANNYKTFELLSSPPAIDMVEFGNQTLVTDYHGKNNPFNHGTIPIDWKGNFNEIDGLNSYPRTNEKILVTGAHEDILRMKTNQIIRLLEHVIQSKILKISLLYYFNTSLTPFIVSCESVVIESKGFLSSVPSSPSARAATSTSGLVHGGSIVDDQGSSSPSKDEELEKLQQSEREERDAMLSKFQMEPSSRGMRIQYNRMESDIEVVGALPSHRSQQKSSSSSKVIQRTASEIYGTDERIKKEISHEVRRNSQAMIPSPQQQQRQQQGQGQGQQIMLSSSADEMTDEDVDNFYRERIPNRTELRSKFGNGKRLTMLGNFISLGPSKTPSPGTAATAGGSALNGTGSPQNKNNTNTLTSTILSQYKIGIGTERYPKDSIKSKHYAQPTDSCTYRIKAYSDRIKGPPLGTATGTESHTASKKSLHSNKSQSQDLLEDYQGVHGVEVGGVRASGLVKKLSHQGHTCWGNYCNLLSSLHASPEDTKEYLHSIGMIKVTASDGSIRIKSTRTELNQITCKSILLAKTESKYIGGELSVMENIESYEYLEGDVLNACAHQHVQKVAEKCRREAFASIFHHGLRAVPTMSDLQAVAYTYRNMIYNDALSQVHPARFYLTVPACRICSQLYTALDRYREEYIYRPNSQDPVIKTINQVDEGNLTAEIVHKAREVLKMKANSYRDTQQQQQQQWQRQRQGEGEDVPESEGDGGKEGEEEEEEEEEENEFEVGEPVQGKSTQVLSPSQMVNHTSLPTQQQQEQGQLQQGIQRQKSELPQDHQLGGSKGGATHSLSNSNPPQASSRTLLKQVGGHHSGGSFPVWVDLMVTAASASGRTPRGVDDERKDKKMSRPNTGTSAGTDTGAAPNSPSVQKMIERRKSIQMLRKVEKMDWRAMLRDSDVTTAKARALSRPQSAGAVPATALNSYRAQQLVIGTAIKDPPLSQRQSQQQTSQEAQQGGNGDRNAFGGSWNPSSASHLHNPLPYGETGMLFGQAPFLPYRPKMEDEQQQHLQQPWHKQQSQPQSQGHTLAASASAPPAGSGEEEDLYFLYSPSSPSPLAHNPSHHRLPRAFPVAGAVADSKYRK